MVKISIKLDKRRILNNGRYPLKFKVARKDSAMYIPTGYELKDSEWDAKNEKVKNRTDKNLINLKLSKRIVVLNDRLQELQFNGKLRSYSNKKLIEYLAGQDESNPEKQYVKAQFEDFIKTKTKDATIKVYRATMYSLSNFCDFDNLLLEDIDIDWLSAFEKYQRSIGNVENTIASRLRNIRAIINFARKRGDFKDYVFDNYSIKTKETTKRSLTVGQLRTLYNCPTTKTTEKYKDVFFLTFFLMGINIVDLARLQPLQGERINYERAKTGTLYDIKVEPEAYQIIEKYKGQTHLLSFFDTDKSYSTFQKSLNTAIQKLSTDIGLPPVTLYWARHTFATLAYEIDIPIDIIAQCLGHKSGHKMTDIYIRKDQAKIDAANRRVIDYFLYNKK